MLVYLLYILQRRGVQSLVFRSCTFSKYFITVTAFAIRNVVVVVLVLVLVLVIRSDY